MFTISKEFAFSASHQLKGLSEDHPCSRLHGHNYVVKVALAGELDEVGFVRDYRDLSVFKEWLDRYFDHRHLNDVLPFNPTAEHMAEFLYRVLRDECGIQTSAVSVSETPKTWATYTPGGEL